MYTYLQSAVYGMASYNKESFKIKKQQINY